MRRYERRACHKFDAVVAVSREDAEHIQQQYGVANVYDVPTGVTLITSGRRRRPSCRTAWSLSARWIGLPNEDGIVYFAEEVLRSQGATAGCQAEGGGPQSHAARAGIGE